MRMRLRDEDGQAVILVALSMSIFLLGAVGLAVDGSQLYSQRQMAQSAADAAAQAAMLSIYNGTNTSGSTAFSTSASFTCGSTTNASTPCVYASKNGFGSASGDTITIDYPADTAAPGVSFSNYAVNLVRVTVSRNVSTTLIRFLGPSATTISAQAMAAIVSVLSPTPILVTHPTLTSSLYMNGTNTIKICGGPSRSIQVNSTSSTAYSPVNGTIDLSHAGPNDSSTSPCTSGTGADFAVSGGDLTNPGNVSLGTTGTYRSEVSHIDDPFANVAAPTAPTTSGTSANIANGTHGCTTTGGCVEYTPGLWPQLKPGKNAVIFDPGLYYVQGGGVDFKQTTGGGTNFNAMCVGCTADTNTGSGMLIYDTVAAGTAAYPASRPTGGFTIDTQASLSLQGPTLTTTNSQGQTVPASPYYDILFWEDRTANAHTGNNNHQIGQGNGCFTLVGTVYITNTRAIMLADSTHYQAVQYNGTPCSTTIQQGDIIVGTLTLKGTTTLSMQLVPYGFLNVNEVALVQ